MVIYNLSKNRTELSKDFWTELATTLAINTNKCQFELVHYNDEHGYRHTVH